MSFEDAVEILDDAGMLPQQAPQSTTDLEEIDSLLMGAPPSVRVTAIGETFFGVITAIKAIQQTDFKTRKPVFWEDGRPKLQIVLTVRDGTDGELKSLYIGNRAYRNAARDAAKKAGTGFRVGGQIAVKLLDETQKPGQQYPDQTIAMAYDPPGTDSPKPVTNVSTVSRLPAAEDPPF